MKTYHKITLPFFILFFFACLPQLTHAEARPTVGLDTVVLKDAIDVPSAAESITNKLQAEGFEIVLTVNHSGAAASVGLDLPPNQVIFARPPHILEKALLARGNTIALDLPIKFHLFAQDGAIKLSTNTLGYLIDRHDLSIRDVVLHITDKLLTQFGKPDTGTHGLVTVKSAKSLGDTVEALQKAILTNPDAKIPLVLNYGKTAEMTSVLIVFGNAKVGTPLMQADPRMGIDLPLKFLVWQDNKSVYITYNDPFFIAGRIDLQGVDARLTAIANALKNIAAAGGGV